MSCKYYPDGNGDTFKVFEMDDGTRVSANIHGESRKTMVTNTQNLATRDSDVFVCSYPRSGNVLQRQLCIFIYL